MNINKFYPLVVWSISLFTVALVCTCWPEIRLYPLSVGHESMEFWAGFFCGVLKFGFEFSVIIFVCLWLLFYLFTAVFYWSPLAVKSMLFIFFLIGAFIYNQIDYPGTLLHPFYIAYSLITAWAISLFNVYRFDWRYYR